MSCCLALSDLLRFSHKYISYDQFFQHINNFVFRFRGMRGLNDDMSRLSELWTQIFRVMDDVHEGTRNAAENTALVLSKVNLFKKYDLGNFI